MLKTKGTVKEKKDGQKSTFLYECEIGHAIFFCFPV